MNKKQVAFVAGLLGTGVLAASALFYKKAQEEKRKDQLLSEVRAFFADLGEIAVVYILSESSTTESLTGGVVMESGQVYLFEYVNGQLTYEEEKE